MNQKILIFGDGQIGNSYLIHFKQTGVSAKIASNIDIRNFKQVRAIVDSYKPTVVINTAAMTDLEWCGNNRLEAFDINVLGAATVAKVCDEKDVYMIHFSSGCIFSSIDGKDAKDETDTPNPSSYYGWTKVWSEKLVLFERSSNFKCLILRPRQPVSTQVNHKNMLVKMLTFSNFVDTANSGTVIEDLMIWTDQLIEKTATGVYHVANAGHTTPYKIGLLIKKHILPTLNLKKITKAELDKMTPNTRVDTVLNIKKLQDLGIAVKPYENRLEATIQQLAVNIKTADKDALRKELEKTAGATKQRAVLNNVYTSLYT